MPRAKKKSEAQQSIEHANAHRMLGQVKLASARAGKANAELERNCVRASMAGASLREIAAVAGFGSHHKVQEILARHGSVEATT